MKKWIILGAIAVVLLAGFIAIRVIGRQGADKFKAFGDELGQRDRIQRIQEATKHEKTTFTARELQAHFKAYAKDPESIKGRMVTVTGLRTMSGSSRDTFTAKRAVIFLDASPDGVTSSFVMCSFRPAEGKNFSVNFLQWLRNAPDGSEITIQGKITMLQPKDGKDTFSVEYYLDHCTIPD